MVGRRGSGGRWRLVREGRRCPFFLEREVSGRWKWWKEETYIVDVAELLNVFGGCEGFVDVDVHLGLEL